MKIPTLFMKWKMLLITIPVYDICLNILLRMGFIVLKNYGIFKIIITILKQIGVYKPDEDEKDFSVVFL